MTVEDRLLAIQRPIYPTEVTDVALVNGSRVMAEMAVGKLPQDIDLFKEHKLSLKVGVEVCGLGGRSWL